MREDSCQTFVGPAGWSYPDWRGFFVDPKAGGKTDSLTYLTRFFNTVEINSTFYRPPEPRTCETWLRKTADVPDFNFTAKLWQRLTHEFNTKTCGADAQSYKNSLQILLDSGRLGALLIQFPWSFKNAPKSREQLEWILEEFSEYPKVVEVRHLSWQRPEFLEFLGERRTAFCNIDQPVIGESIGPSSEATSPIGYVRLHGRNYDKWFAERADASERYNYLYSEEELQPWVERIRTLQQRVAKLFIITNNHYRAQAIVNAFQILHMLTGQKQPVPPVLQSAYPVLRPISEQIHPEQLKLL